MRSNLLTSAAMLMALLTAAPASAEEEAAEAQTESMSDTQEASPAAEGVTMEAESASEAADTAAPLDAGMAEAAAEQEAMEAEAAAEAEMASKVEAPIDEAATMVEEAQPAMERVTSEVITGTVVETTGPAALPPEDMNIPVRGMHMDQVEKMYGKPMGINPPVGEPPITRWDYPGYAVYFEYSYVIQSVPK